MTDQHAEKIYNVDAIKEAHFGDKYYGDKKTPKILSTSLPFLPEFFLGREADLDAVHEKLFSGENLLLLVNGEGGIGKTTFSAKYWREYEKDYSHLAWVFTGNNLLEALLTLAPRLKVSFPEAMPSGERLSDMLAVMAGLDRPCLLVLDNANDADEISRYYQDLNVCANFHILLTSRITRFEQAATYRIPHLDEAHALALFKKLYPGHRDNDNELLKAIRNAVGGNTLVLELLAKNLAAINSDEVFYPLADLLRDLQQKGLFRLAQEEKIKVVGKQNRHGFIETRPTDCQDLRDLGLPVSPGTIADGLQALAPLFQPVVDALYRQQVGERLFHNDETRWEVFEAIDGKTGSRWYLWVTRSASVIYFCIDPSRSAAVPGAHFAGLRQDLVIIVCDRYSAYKKLARLVGAILLAFCWAHVRRDFLDAGRT